MYVPGAHALHVVLPISEVVPGGQSSHAPRPSRLANAPSRQGTHVALEVALMAGLDVPAGQGRHAVLELCALSGLKVPAGQGCQTMAVVAPSSLQ